MKREGLIRNGFKVIPERDVGKTKTQEPGRGQCCENRKPPKEPDEKFIAASYGVRAKIYIRSNPQGERGCETKVKFAQEGPWFYHNF